MLIYFGVDTSREYCQCNHDQRNASTVYSIKSNILIIKDMITHHVYIYKMERAERSDLRQESTNEIEDPDIPDSDSTDIALRLRNVANVSQR